MESHMMNLLCWLLIALPLSAGSPLAANDISANQFSNPVIYSDFPDNDVFLGPDGAYYFSASNFHYSPGAPILKSDDLVNWDVIGHSIPRLTFGDNYDLPANGSGKGNEYRGGTWASSLRYRESNGLWYWIGCTNFWVTWVFTATSPEGPWTNRGAMSWEGVCMYDNGILIDDDDTMYVVFGSNNVRVAQLNPEGTTYTQIQSVFNHTDVGAEGLEGNRMYKINGTYYVLNDQPGGTTYIWKSESPWGPYESKILVQNISPLINGGSSPHQGSLIKTKGGEWYYMSFTWAYPAGRLPVLAPIRWGDDGFPIFVEGSNGGWGESYPLPDGSSEPTKNWDRVDTFAGSSLHPSWEWNHNPDVNSYLVNDGLTLKTASVTDDIYFARNTLTHRTHGEFPVGTVLINYSNMLPGDRAGFAAFRDQTSYIGIHRTGNDYSLVAVHGIITDEWGSGVTQSLGEVKQTLSIPAGQTRVWLRMELDTRPDGTRDCVFLYSFDGEDFVVFGPTYTLYSGWAWFLAYRFGIFNFATEALGGSIKVESFVAASA
uniref:Beta-xylosidase C-terminal Concanavalin A-like domain-containing protein n=1 Tax=Bionectria ochroleuca TaxID=29856 RepID=A0A8H7K124_BIOOC